MYYAGTRSLSDMKRSLVTVLGLVSIGFRVQSPPELRMRAFRTMGVSLDLLKRSCLLQVLQDRHINLWHFHVSWATAAPCSSYHPPLMGVCKVHGGGRKSFAT